MKASLRIYRHKPTGACIAHFIFLLVVCFLLDEGDWSPIAIAKFIDYQPYALHGSLRSPFLCYCFFQLHLGWRLAADERGEARRASEMAGMARWHNNRRGWDTYAIDTVTYDEAHPELVRRWLCLAAKQMDDYPCLVVASGAERKLRLDVLGWGPR